MNAGREPRTYRTLFSASDLRYLSVLVEQTDLRIGIGHAHGEPVPDGKALREARQLAIRETVRARTAIEAQIRENPAFLTSLVPMEVADGGSLLVRRMVEAARAAEVGPMAAVAGAVAEQVGKRLGAFFTEVIVENGGDLWIQGTRPRLVGVWCGQSRLNGRFALRMQPAGMPLGLCTSSATIGHSLSLGRADAATVHADSAALADAVATALGNRVRSVDAVEAALAWAMGVPGVRGAMVVIGEHMGMLGQLELVPV